MIYFYKAIRGKDPHIIELHGPLKGIKKIKSRMDGRVDFVREKRIIWAQVVRGKIVAEFREKDIFVSDKKI